MGHIYTVRRGDCLWGLACRYLGNGMLWPEIYKYHNTEVERRGWRGHERMKIKDENLIFVGQTIYIPSRFRDPSLSGCETKGKNEGGNPAVGVDLNLKYTIGHDTPPAQYVAEFIDYTIRTEIAGQIGLEISSSDKYRHNLELLMSNDMLQAKQKLNETYDPAVAALTANPEVVFESGRVKVRAPIAANANIGPYTIDVQAETPMKMSGTLKPSTISGSLELGRRIYKYNADIEIKAEVEWRPRPSARAEAPVTAQSHEAMPKVAAEPNRQKSWSEAVDDHGGIVATVAYTIMGAIALWYMRGMALQNQTTSFMPFTHSVNPKKFES